MKNKILLSWTATRNDFFIRNEENELVKSNVLFNMDGPHINLYKHFPDFFDVHYMFCTIDYEKQEPLSRFTHFANYLTKESGKKVFVEPVLISDIMDVAEIKSKMKDFILRKFHTQEVQVFVNPGAPAMQTAWYLIGMELDSVKLFNVKEARFTEDGKKPERNPIVFESSEYARAVNMVQISHDRDKREAFKTDSYEKVYERARKLGGNINSTVLIQGDTGTGKEILAQHIHEKSSRSKKKMISINCAAYHGDLLESRLFGYVKGAFTGANKDTKGVFEMAQGSTLFLDEIGDISPRMQATLLRVLQERKIMKVGSTEEVKLDVRIITATNRDLWKMCKKGTFRFDLFYRLAIAELKLPSFANLFKPEKRKWINYFLEQKKNDVGRNKQLTLSKKVWDILLSHLFIGNLRELQAVIESFYVFCTDENIVTEEYVNKRVLERDEDISPTLKSVTDAYKMKVLKQYGGNVAKASKILDINEGTVRTWKKNNYPKG